MNNYLLIPFLPLAAFDINILFGRSLIRDKAHWVAVTAVAGSWVVAVMTLFDVLSGKTVNQDLYTWITSGNFKVSVGFLIDQLTAVMLIVVTTCSTLIHIYSIGPAPISFLSGVDPGTGIIVEKGHPLEGESITGRVLVFSHGKGSTVGSYVLYALARNGKAPAAIINSRADPIIAVGAIMGKIPMVDEPEVSIMRFRKGIHVTVDGSSARLTMRGNSSLNREDKEFFKRGLEHTECVMRNQVLIIIAVAVALLFTTGCTGNFPSVLPDRSPSVPAPGPTVTMPPGQSVTVQVNEKDTSYATLLFGYFLLAEQEKVTCRRAAPGQPTVASHERPQEAQRLPAHGTPRKP